MSRLFKSESNCRVEIIHELLNGLDLLGGTYEDQDDVIYECVPERDSPDVGFPDGFFMTSHEEVGIWWVSLGSHGCPDKLEKIPVHE